MPRLARLDAPGVFHHIIVRGIERRKIIRKNGKKEYAVLPYEEFLKVQEKLEDYDDLRCLREAKEVEKDAPAIGMAELKKEIGRRTRRWS